jgi:hypothetical protein
VLSVALLVDAYAGDDLHGRNEMAFDRANFDAFWDDWLDINRRAQEAGDWGIMASFYEPDASYGWSYSPTDHFMANGRDEIRDLALGTEMLGFQGWIYPYQGVIFDDRSGQAFGLWRQLTTFKSPSGEPYEIKGLGASWFQYSGNRSWSWQRDIFDVAMATDAMVQILRDGDSSPQLDERMRAIKSGNQPGHYDSWESMSAPLWPIPAVMQ